MSSRHVNAPLLVILLLAFALRLIALNSRPVWYDEAFAILLAERDPGIIALGTAADTMPPLYYTLLHYWLSLVGETPLALRMLNVAISMLIVALLAVMATRWFGTRAGRYAALFAALAPFQIYHAQELRMYGILALAQLLYLYAVARLGSRGIGVMMAIAFSTALALYSHNLAFLTLVAANVYFVVRRDWTSQLKLVAAQGIGALAFVPWLLYVPGQVAKIQRAFWTQPPYLADILQMLMVFTMYLPLPGILFAAGLFVTLAVGVIAALEIVRLSRRGAPPALGLLLAFVLVPPVLMFALSYLIRPIFVPRGVIASSLVYYVLLAMLAARAPRAGQIMLVVVAGGIAAGALPFFYTSWGEWRRAPFAEADQFLRAKARPDDLILHDNKLSFFSMYFYDRALPQQYLADPPGSANDTLAPGSQEAFGLFPVNLDAAIRSYPRVWFVIFQTAIDQATEEGHPHGNLSQLDGTMRRSDVANFADLRIFLYETR